MRPQLIGTSVMVLAGTSPNHTRTLNLVEGMERGLITLEARALGGHHGVCVEVTLTNTGSEALSTTIPAGWLLAANAAEVQDLMIAQNLMVDLPAKSARSTRCEAYCVESQDLSPGENGTFRSTGQARPTWTKLAERLAVRSTDPAIAQAAVWAVTNGHDIAGIGSPDNVDDKDLRAFVADLTGRTVPWYSKAYATPRATRGVFSDEPTTIKGQVEFRMRNNGVLTVQVHDAQGHLVRTIGKDRVLGPGPYSMDVELTVTGWLKGEYTLSFRADHGQLLKRMTFSV